jgi:hypothetical protein
VAHFPSCPLSIPKISSPPPPCPHPCKYLPVSPLLLLSLGTTSFEDTTASLLAGASPLLPLNFRLVVVAPLIALRMPLVHLMLCCTLSTDTFPPVCLLFASWLLHCPGCCAAASSCSLEAPPLPCATLPLCLLLFPVASCLPAGCHAPSHCAASTSHHLLLHCHLMCPSSTPCLHLHWLVVAPHLVTLPPPPILLSTAAAS